jgi:hypothetical protein
LAVLAPEITAAYSWVMRTMLLRKL